MFLALLGTPALAITPRQIQETMDRGIAFLYLQQNHDGNWETTPHPESGRENWEPQGGQWGGTTALVTYSLLASGENPRDSRIQKAIRFLETADIHGIYALGLRSQVWGYLPAGSALRSLIQRDGRSLIGGLRGEPDAAGMYGYLSTGPAQADHLFDHSVSQYGVLGVWALQDAGLEVPDQYWKAVDSAWRRDQLPDGAWSYYARPQGVFPESVTLTAAGVASLFLSDDYLRASAGLDCRDNLADPEIDRGIAWIGDHFSSTFQWPNRPCYALYGIERIGAASGRRLLGSTDWYAQGADYLLKHQSYQTGSWDQGNGPVADTALALIFLNRGRAPVVMNKLDISPTPSNQRPRDAAHLTRWISRMIEANRPLNWQSVAVADDPDDWHDAPILYVSSNQALKLSGVEEAKLKQFIEDGGLILFNSNCGRSPAFNDSVFALGRRLYQQDFQPLPKDHVLFTNEQFRAAQWRNPPETLAISNGARVLMILIPAADFSAAWQVNSPLLHPEAFDLGADIFLYATDKQNLRTKGESYVVRADPAVQTKTSIKLARLIWPGDWNPEPGGWRRLSAIMHNRDQTDLEIAEATLGDGSLLTGGFTIAHLTGTKQLFLSPAMQDDLKRFVAQGGKLIIDSTGGSRPFAVSARSQLDKLFPDQASQLDTPLPIEHPFFNRGLRPMMGREIEYRTYSQKVLSSVKQPRLRAIEINERLAVFYSAEDISEGLVGQNIDGIVGYTPDTAAKLMERMILGAAP